VLDGLLGRLGGRERVTRVLSGAVAIGVVVWIVTEAAFYIAVVGWGANGSFSGWMGWAQVLTRVAYDVWLGALALLLLIWLAPRVGGPRPAANDRNGHRDTDLPSD
jgi:hypothetical protein